MASIFAILILLVIIGIPGYFICKLFLKGIRALDASVDKREEKQAAKKDITVKEMRKETSQGILKDFGSIALFIFKLPFIILGWIRKVFRYLGPHIGGCLGNSMSFIADPIKHVESSSSTYVRPSNPSSYTNEKTKPPEIAQPNNSPRNMGFRIGKRSHVGPLKDWYFDIHFLDGSTQRLLGNFISFNSNNEITYDDQMGRRQTFFKRGQ